MKWPLHGSFPLTEFCRITFKLCMNYMIASFASSWFTLYNTLQLILLLSLLHISERTHSHSPCCVSWWIHVFAFKNWTVLQRHKKLIKHKVYLAVLKNMLILVCSTNLWCSDDQTLSRRVSRTFPIIRHHSPDTGKVFKTWIF